MQQNTYTKVSVRVTVIYKLVKSSPKMARSKARGLIQCTTVTLCLPISLSDLSRLLEIIGILMGRWSSNPQNSCA